MVENGIILPAKSFDGRNPFTGKSLLGNITWKHYHRPLGPRATGIDNLEVHINLEKMANGIDNLEVHINLEKLI